MWHSVVNAGLTPLGTAVTRRHNTNQGPSTLDFCHEGSPWVALAGVLATPIVASADHLVVDDDIDAFVAMPPLAFSVVNHWHIYHLEETHRENWYFTCFWSPDQMYVLLRSNIFLRLLTSPWFADIVFFHTQPTIITNFQMNSKIWPSDTQHSSRWNEPSFTSDMWNWWFGWNCCCRHHCLHSFYEASSSLFYVKLPFA